MLSFSPFSDCSSNIITAPFKSAGNMASSAGSAVVARIQMVGEKVRQAYTKPSLLTNSHLTGGVPTTTTTSTQQQQQQQPQQQTQQPGDGGGGGGGGEGLPRPGHSRGGSDQFSMSQSLVLPGSSGAAATAEGGGGLMSHSEHQYMQVRSPKDPFREF